MLWVYGQKFGNSFSAGSDFSRQIRMSKDGRRVERVNSCSSLLLSYTCTNVKKQLKDL